MIDPFPGESVRGRMWTGTQWISWSDNFTIATSPDAVNWTVAIVNPFTNTSQIPDAPVISNNNFAGSTYKLLCYSEGTTKLACSVDGTRWTSISQFSGMASGDTLENIAQIIWASPYWVVRGTTTSGVNVIGISTNGLDFTNQTFSAPGYIIDSITGIFFNGLNSVIVSAKTTNTSTSIVYFSTFSAILNAWAWTYNTTGKEDAGSGDFQYIWNGNYWLGYSDLYIIEYRTGSWVDVTNPSLYTLINIVWNPNQEYWLVVSQDTANNDIYISTLNADLTVKDANTKKTVFNGNLVLPTWNVSYWVAGGSSLFRSTDGLSWTKQTTSTGLFIPLWNGSYWLSFNYPLTFDKTYAFKSIDGVSWDSGLIANRLIIIANNNPWNGSYWVLYYNNGSSNIFLKSAFGWVEPAVAPNKKILQLHPLADVYRGPPIPINFLYTLGATSSISLSVTRAQLLDTFTGLRLTLLNVAKNNTIIRKKAQTTNFTTANNVSSASISLFVVNAGNILKFGLIQFEGRSRNKWYTLGYVKNRIFRVT